MIAASIELPRFKLLTVEEILTLPDPEWLVQNLVPASSLAQLYGKSGIGKTFVALDMALCVASGSPWLDTHEVRQGPVVYVAAEGHRGMKTRVAAWLRERGLSAQHVDEFRLIGEAVPLANPDDVQALVKQVEEAFEGKPLSLVVLDTQARCTAGLDENSAKEMGLAVKAAEGIKRSTEATVLLIHHSGYERSHPRGSTAVHAALDAQMKLDGQPDALRLVCEKQKDDQEFEDIHLVLMRVEDSLVVMSEQDPTMRLRRAEARLPERAHEALDALRRAPRGLTATEWEEAADMARSSFYEARKTLVELGLAGKEGDLYVPVSIGLKELPGASPPEVHRSTTPLGGGPLDLGAEGEDQSVKEHVECAWEDSHEG